MHIYIVMVLCPPSNLMRKKISFLIIGYVNLDPDHLQLIILSYYLSAYYNYKIVSKKFENYKDNLKIVQKNKLDSIQKTRAGDYKLHDQGTIYIIRLRYDLLVFYVDFFFMPT